jgi:hypothetical protein
MGKLLDNERFKNVNYHHTDIAATFKRIRREQEAAQRAKEAAEAEKVQRLHVLYPNLHKAAQ